MVSILEIILKIKPENPNVNYWYVTFEMIIKAWMWLIGGGENLFFIGGAYTL